MIIYIHGFASHGEGKKAKVFREYFKTKDQKFIAPSLSYVPDLAIKTLEELIECCDEEVYLIGSSLGGYHSLYLSHKYNLKAVLINPSIHPEVTLKKMLGFTLNFYDNSQFEWLESHIDMLNAYKVANKENDQLLLLLQKGDAVLNYKEAQDELQNAILILEAGGSHSFEGIERHFNVIERFLK